MCLNYLVDAISFSVPPDDTDYVTDEFLDKVVETFKNLDPVYVERLPFKIPGGDQHNTPAHMCIWDAAESWAISAGYHEGVEIVFNKPANSEQFELFGLLEEMPNINPQLTRTQLESLFLTGTGPGEFLQGFSDSPVRK